jgi:diguanylate cyclase (GGDEF)-like protein/PAS domain S-box-containing protein
VHVLLVHSGELDGVPVRTALSASGCEVVAAGHLSTALAWLEAEPFDAMVASLRLADADGLEVVRRVRAAAPHLALVVLAGPDDEVTGLEALRSGAQDCLPERELDGRLIERSLRYAVERARLEAAVQEAEARLRNIQEQAPVAICMIAPDGGVTALNPEFQRMTGWPTEEWIGQPFSTLLHPEDQAGAVALLRRALEGESPPPLDLRLRARGRGYLITAFTALPVTKLAHVTDVIGMARDVTELRQVEARERETARTDYLTGLANRRACEEAVAREVARASRENTSVGLALFDVDHFKAVNDTHGHHTGDAVLRAIAALLQDATRAYDVAGRWGGEEFLAILPGADLAGARIFAERIRVAVAALDGLPCRVTASAGLAVWTRGQDVQRVLARADSKLYEAKRAGRDRVC